MIADTEIDIKSPHLDRLFKEIFDGVPDLKLNESPPIVSILNIVQSEQQLKSL